MERREEEEEEEEEWLLQSLKMYNDLHVFELQDPTRVIEWTGEKSVCVAGYESGKRNEILQLALPPRLYPKENQGLCPERDFKVERGGFSDRPVCSLKHVPGTRVLVTSGPPDPALQVWHLETDETDIIKPLGTIPTISGAPEGWAKMAASEPARVLHGVRMDNLQMTDLESKQALFTAASPTDEEISTLDFLDEATAVACGAKGQLFLVDTRHPRSPLAASGNMPEALREEKWCAAVRRNPPATEEPLVAQLSSGGRMVLTDLRNAVSPLGVARCSVPAAALRGVDYLSVSFAPLLRGCLSVSGFDGTVHVYDTHGWDSSATREAEPLFVHKGHVFSGADGAGPPPLVTAHTWHPSKPRTLLSAASDGSLHVWDWLDPRGAS